MPADAAFSGMVQLDSCVYLYKPTSPSKSSDAAAPELVILCTWMLAQPTHITKYIKGYQNLYPSASILMIRSGPLDFVYRGRGGMERRLKAAVAVVRSSILSSATQDSTPKAILQVFSNGGSLQAATLFRAYQKTTGDVFPLHTTVLDSCPGRATFYVAFRVLLLPFGGQPSYIRLPVTAFLYITFGLWWLIMFALRMENPFETLWQGLNDEEQVKETRRVYVYSDADNMVPWQDIEDHAAEARIQRFNVELEKFKGSGHVAHVRIGNGGRYWGIIDEQWKKSAARYK